MNDASAAIPGTAAVRHGPPVEGLRTLAPEALERFVYLVGAPRGGTTVIYHALRLSDRVFGLPGLTHFMSHVWKHRNRVHRRLLRQIFAMPSFFRQRQILESLDHVHRRRVERWLHDAFERKHLGQMYQAYPLLYALDPACAKDPARALCWADKANDIYGLFDIPRYLPQARFIFITRDPRGAAASMRRQTIVSRGDEDSEEAAHGSLVASCIYWRNMMQTLLRFATRYPDRTRFVRYEDFVHAPEETINELLEFAAGERMVPERLREGIAELKHSRRHDPTVCDRGIDVRPLTRWQQMLRPDEAALVSALVGATARKLGYSPGPAASAAALIRAVLRLEGREKGAAAAKLAFLELREPFVPVRAGAEPVQP